MQIRRVLDSNPHPQSVLEREDEKGPNLDTHEEGGIPRLELRHRFQHDRNQIDDDEKDNQPADHAARLISDRAVLQDLVEAMPQLQRASAVSRHINFLPGRVWLGGQPC
jgi:hypothetical protein